MYEKMITGKRKDCSKEGFTLVELLVALFISSVIAAVVIADFGTFTSETVFKNKALDVALAIREAQVYGISGKKVAGYEDVRYGVYFDRTAYRDGRNISQFFIFADTNKNGEYDSGEEIDTIEFKKADGYVIDDVCLYNVDYYWNVLGTYYYITSASVVCGDSFSLFANFRTVTLFSRTGTGADIQGRAYSGGAYKNADRMEVIFERLSDGATKTITVYNTGGITVN